MGALADADDWQEAIDGVDARLIDGFQSGFPVEERPFQTVGQVLGIPGAEALARVRRLLDGGVFRRVGPVLNPPVLGASTLAAVSAPSDRLAAVAAVVNGYPQVNHNYRRDHEWNTWFVVTAGSLAERDRILDEIGERTGLNVLNLPMRTGFYIDLEFPVVNQDRLAGGVGDDGLAGPVGAGGTNVSATRIPEGAAVDLSALERDVLLEAQDGFPLTRAPYRAIAEGVGADVGQVLDAIERLQGRRCIKRIGCVVDHVSTGFDANCMAVWDVPDDELEERGEAVGRLPFVTLCYHRPRRPDAGWPYNLFTMVHGRDSDAVDRKLDQLADGHLPYPHDRLYSTETLKQTGARYEHLVGD